MHQGNGFILAETGGVEEVTLTVNQIPAHTHPMLSTNDLSTSTTPLQHVLCQSANKNFRAGNPSVNLSPQAIGPVGGSQPHTNFQPYLCVDFIISLFGIFPSPT